MSKEEHTISDAESRKKADKRVLTIFLVIAFLSLLLPLVLVSLYHPSNAFAIVSNMLVGLTFAFIIAGFYSYVKNRRLGRVSRKRLFNFFVSISAVGSVVFSVVLIIFVNSEQTTQIQGLDKSVTLIILFIVFIIVNFISFIIGIYFVLVLAFGVVGVMAALQRWLTPRILRTIVQSGGKSDLSVTERVLRWLFDVPDVLDTRSLTLASFEPKSSISRSELGWAVAWQLFFGAILAIYVSFNPFFTDFSTDSLLSVFSALSSVSSFIPLLILSWFIYRRLNARIKGPVKDYTMYGGLRARIFQSYIAIGTLVILIRLSITKVNLEAYASGYALFMGQLFLTALVCTFVYLNNFENALAEDITASYHPAGAEPPGATGAK